MPFLNDATEHPSQGEMTLKIQIRNLGPRACSKTLSVSQMSGGMDSTYTQFSAESIWTARVSIYMVRSSLVAKIAMGSKEGSP